MLFRKMLRDIYENKIAYFACALVLAIGLLSYISMSLAKDNLISARDEFYSQYRFADGFASVKMMPESKLDEIRKIEGIDRVEGRLVKDVRILVEDKDRNVALKIISIKPEDKARLNDIEIMSGAFPTRRTHEILVADKFYKANNFKLQSEINALIGGKKVSLAVSGRGQSPEFIYVIRNIQDTVPNPKDFEVAYMNYAEMEQIFDSQGLVNDISFTIRQGYKFKDIEEKVKDRLKPYSVASLVGRENQISNLMLNEELKQLEKSATTTPFIFILISSTIIYIMLRRLVEAQRPLIGIMKSFGYTKSEVLRHYLSYGFIIGSVGGVAGGLLGIWCSNFFTTMYQTYYSLPNLKGRFSLSYFVTGVILSILFCLVAALQGSKAVLKLNPAEAMHPETPKFHAKTFIERIPGVWFALTVQGRMAVRNIARNKARSIFTLIGVLGAFCLMAVLFSENKLVEVMITDQFTKVQRHDMKIGFARPVPRDSVEREIMSNKGVALVEPMFEVPATVKNLNLKKDIVIIGLKQGSQLYRILDKSQNEVLIPKTGAILSELVAEKLNASIGTRLRVESLLAKDSPFYIDVEKIIPQYLGSNIYMSIDYLEKLVGQGNIVTSMLLTIDQKSILQIKQKYVNSDYISLMEVRQQTIDKYKDIMGAFVYTLLVLGMIAVFTGFAIVYNSSIISFEERKRELASLRVLGMTRKEVREVISIEQAILGVLGMILGIPAAYYVNVAMAKGLSSDLYTMPVVMDPMAFAQASAGTIAAISLAMIWINKRIKRLDMVEVLKERE